MSAVQASFKGLMGRNLFFGGSLAFGEKRCGLFYKKKKREYLGCYFLRRITIAAIAIMMTMTTTAITTMTSVDKPPEVSVGEGDGVAVAVGLEVGVAVAAGVGDAVAVGLGDVESGMNTAWYW